MRLGYAVRQTVQEAVVALLLFGLAVPMPYEVNVDHEQRRVHVVGQDPIRVEDLLAVLDRQIGEAAWSYGTLHDARAVTWVPSSDDVRELISHLSALVRQYGRRGPVAIISPPGSRFGMARMYEFLAEDRGQTVSVFQSTEAAEAWLSLYAGS
jgi:hypothetical protein